MVIEKTYRSAKVVRAASRKVWRQWLQKYHAKEKKVWLIIYHKKSSVRSVYYNDAVEEALCFGWIDSTPNKRDEESFYLSFYPRKPKSKWSKLNRERVSRLMERDLMTPAGIAMVELAKQSGTWTALEKIDNEEIPDDLALTFSKQKKAFKNFMAFSSSARKMILEWIDNARRKETRAKRIQQTVTMAKQNLRANFDKI